MIVGSTRACTSLYFEIACYCLHLVVEGKRSPALTAVWLARNRFAMLDKTHQVGLSK